MYEITHPYQRSVVTVLLVLAYFLMPTCGYYYNDWNLANHILYPFSHANIFHLMGNVLFIWMIRCPLNLHLTVPCAIICSFLPCLTSEPTTGFSGVLFAMVGMSWGRIHRLNDMVWRNKWYLVIPFFIPHVNAFIHIYCLFAGYLCGHLLTLPKQCVRK